MPKLAYLGLPSSLLLGETSSSPTKPIKTEPGEHYENEAKIKVAGQEAEVITPSWIQPARCPSPEPSRAPSPKPPEPPKPLPPPPSVPVATTAPQQLQPLMAATTHQPPLLIKPQQNLLTTPGGGGGGEF